jgi:DNA-binding transcriptional ArsR family regulator
MSQGIASLHKILKDETRQKIITLLAKRGNLSYSELLEEIDVLIGILNYHLKVLGDLLQKNELGQYSLSDRGQLAYRLLTEFPNDPPKVVDKRIYKAWIILTAGSVIFLILNGYFFNIPIERTALALAVLLSSTAIAFYVRVKPSTSSNRVFFIVVGGTMFGSLLWFVVFWLFNVSMLRWSIVRSSGDLAFNLILLSSLIICWVLGGYIGDWIGRRRSYVIPIIRV